MSFEFDFSGFGYFSSFLLSFEPFPTGPLSSVWKEWVKWCIEFGIEANAIIAVPYDWRLSPSMLEERDLYFHKLKFVFLSNSHGLFTTTFALPVSFHLAN